MPEITYKAVDQHLKKNKPFPVYLLYGEELLYKTALESVLASILPDAAASPDFEPIDDSDAAVYTAIEVLNTYSMFSNRKVAALLDSRIFYAKKDKGSFLEKAKEAYDKEDMPKAAKYFAGFLGRSDLDFTDMEKEKREKHLKLDSGQSPDDQWVDDIIAYCATNNVQVVEMTDQSKKLQQVIENGFVQENFLIITTDMVDRRTGLFKSIMEKGLVVNCSVPRGSRKADKVVQNEVLDAQMKKILQACRKTIEPRAYQTVCEMTGFDLRTFTANIRKLIDYAGSRDRITVDDVKAVLIRTRQDPIFELTGAIADRDTETALFYVKSLLGQEFYPLQILAAIVNQVRKLLAAKLFTQSPSGRIWNPRMNYNLFQNQVIPLIQEYDGKLLDQLGQWENMLSTKKSASGKGAAKKPSSDMVIAKNPKNAYPVYQTLLKSEKFTLPELKAAMRVAYGADLDMKTTSRNPKLLLESVILSICRRSQHQGKTTGK